MSCEIVENSLYYKFYFTCEKNKNDLQALCTLTNIPYVTMPNCFAFIDSNAIDALHYFKQYELLEHYLKQPIPFTVFFSRVEDNAMIPTKAHFSDVGYDLHIIRKLNDMTSNTSLYETGIKIKVPIGYYAEIVPRSSLSKSGFMLANSIGIIDNSYQSTLKVALTKTDIYAKDIIYPFKCCQIIFRRQYFINMQEIDNNRIFETITSRNIGGFGSTGI